MSKEIENIAQFVTDIREMERKDQAFAIKLMYGNDSIKEKIAFKLLDEEDYSELEKELSKENS